MNLRSMALVTVFCSASCGPETGTLYPELAFTIGPEIGLTAPRDLSVGPSGNIFIFDYDDYFIHGFDQSGNSVSTFGGALTDEGGFHHLMAIQARGDSLLALDAGSTSVFGPDGALRSHRAFSDTIVCDLPRLGPQGIWAGEWITDETAEKTLTLRGSLGQEETRVAGYSLGQFFPGVEPGGFFFIGQTQAPSFHYDFLQDGQLVWGSSSELVVHRGTPPDGGAALFRAEGLPIPFPPEEIQRMREEQANLSPPLFMNVPEHYQLIHHLLVDETGEIWLFVMTIDRTGFIHLSNTGREMGFYEVETGFDLLSARVTAAGNRLYFMVHSGEETQIYTVDRP
jgi:hypothetical protein